MKNVYLLSVLFLLNACGIGGNLSYVGQHHRPTEKIEVYVNQASIKKNYDVIGIGIFRENSLLSPEKMQLKAETKAKEVGADAVLMEYYSRDIHDSEISTTQISLDSTLRFPTGTITTRKNPISERGFKISFLKYTISE